MRARTTATNQANGSSSLNPYTQPIPQPAANLENLAACVMALKLNVENLTGQRGSPPDRAVTFSDLAAAGVTGSTASRLGTLTVATLPAVATHRGARVFVSDANTTTFAAVVAGGGAHYVPVYCDGVNWRIG